MKWLCLSGWAQEHGKLAKLVNANATEVNYNFYSEGQFPGIETYIPESPYSIICYSMGALLALKAASISKPIKIISISGFANFTGNGQGAKRRKLQILQMIKGLKKDPAKTIKDFSSSAGLPQPQNKSFNVNNLIKGLELLKDCDMSQALDAELTMTLISSDNDKIVPEHISKQLLSGPGERKEISLPGAHGAWQSSTDVITRLLRE